jgi:hypothetical protein
MSPGRDEGYERLLELTRLQSQLVREGRIVEYVVVGEAWNSVASELPETAPKEAEHLLREAVALVDATQAALGANASALAEAIGHVGRGRHAIASYAKA